MADSRSRVVSTLNFLTGKGIPYHPDGRDNSVLEAIIEDYFNRNDDKNDYSSDESANNSEG